LIGRARKSELIALLIMISVTFLRRGASSRALTIPTVSRWLGHKDGGALAIENVRSLAARRTP
jgi:hypothetical protein